MLKHGGSLGNTGCVSYLFDQKGVIVVERKVGLDEDALMEYAIEAGADDVKTEDDAFTVYTSVQNFSEVRKFLEEKGLSFFEASLEMIPQSTVTFEGEAAAKFQKLVDALEDLDDVQDVYHNVDLPEEEEEE